MSRSNTTVAKKPTLDIERTRSHLEALGLMHAVGALQRTLSEAVREGTTGQAFLDTLLKAESAERESRRIGTALRLSSLPPGFTLGDFDFSFQPSIERSRIDTLATSAWVGQNQTLLIHGPPGVGKTHLAIGLGVKAVEQGFSAQFYRFDELQTALKQDAHVPPSKLRRIEIGFDPMDREEASLFFRLVTYRYGRGSILITTNKIVRDWTELLAGDKVLTAAILDRLLHNAHVINIKGRSYRLRNIDHALGEKARER